MPALAPRRSVEARALIEEHRDELEAVLRRYRASNARVFGSVVRGEATTTSDLDLLVELSEPLSLFELARLERDLSMILEVGVDVVPDSGLRHTVRARALAETVPL
ncbi:nucleotidyltransferase family protein [Aeromicrobium piscarium]|uniref:Nucleotidyltransferase family protein n=1 Tax=Aeromicrobium piscarium TaxID=2590901 RepID=A0A554S6Y5_9ACTN|nr:nucleotidyltransferase family protein [Aeromicrobium piscarium]TSD62076.1 nucleotidyltransferase family protein [Aeromicrobium piscarium]